MGSLTSGFAAVPVWLTGACCTVTVPVVMPITAITVSACRDCRQVKKQYGHLPMSRCHTLPNFLPWDLQPKRRSERSPSSLPPSFPPPLPFGGRSGGSGRSCPSMSCRAILHNLRSKDKMSNKGLSVPHPLPQCSTFSWRAWSEMKSSSCDVCRSNRKLTRGL